MQEPCEALKLRYQGGIFTDSVDLIREELEQKCLSKSENTTVKSYSLMDILTCICNMSVTYAKVLVTSIAEYVDLPSILKCDLPVNIYKQVEY